MEFLITGRIREKESERPVPGLFVRAFDKDLIYSDLLGNATTDSTGNFAIGYERKDFQELFDARPDIYLEVYGSATAKDPGRAGDEPIYKTEFVRFNAGKREHFEILIPRTLLGSDAPGAGTISPPKPGKWKQEIDEWIKSHPIGFQYDPNKGFAAPKLICTSNFWSETRNLRVGDSGWVTVIVSNLGNGPSHSAYVQLYDCPEILYSNSLKDYKLRDYRVFTINPGQTVNVKFYWSPRFVVSRIVGVCFDPFLDPRGFTLVEKHHPHITSSFVFNPPVLPIRVVQ